MNMRNFQIIGWKIRELHRFHDEEKVEKSAEAQENFSRVLDSAVTKSNQDRISISLKKNMTFFLRYKSTFWNSLV